jgi:F-type H+-transporting ATPase subunit O
MFIMMSSRLARPAIAAARRTASKTALRGYAAPAAADAKPPVALFGVDGTYASALVCKPEATLCRNQSARFTKTWASAGREETAVLDLPKQHFAS